MILYKKIEIYYLYFLKQKNIQKKNLLCIKINKILDFIKNELIYIYFNLIKILNGSMEFSQSYLVTLGMR